MKTPAQRAKDRAAREKRTAKQDGSWYCAGCRVRHLAGQRCPQPRLLAKGFNRV